MRNDVNGSGGPLSGDSLADVEHSLPTQARVKVLSWWAAGLISIFLTFCLTCAVIGVPRSFFADPSPAMVILRYVAIVGVPLGVFASLYYLNGALRPQHLTVDDDGVHTPRWHLAWDEILAARAYPSPEEMSHKQQLRLAVTEDAFERVRRQNRWNSGRPFHMGGLLPVDQTIRSQYDIRPLPGELAGLIQQEADRKNPYRVVPTWARSLRPHDAPPLPGPLGIPLAPRDPEARN